MPHRLTLLVAGLALAALPSPALAQSGGAAAPTGGGHAFEQPTAPAAPAAPRLRASVFAVTPGSVTLGTPVRFAWHIDGPVRRVRARVDLLPAAGGPAVRVALGTRRAGAPSARTWTPLEGTIAPGRYTARLHAWGAGGAKLRRTARASGRLALEITAPPAPSPPAPAPPSLFPVQGPYTLGGDEARFGAPRRGHVHRGQDVIAAEGTPLVTPVAGLVHWRAFQASGAGHYVVVRGDDGRDYAYMHLQDGSLLVEQGQRLAAGQRLGSVGDTGDSRGAHLHFEIWPGGWYAKGSEPIDPLPDLLAWAAGG